MRSKEFWKYFLAVFLVSFIVNLAVTFLWDIVFHNDKGSYWDMTSAVATSTAIAVALVFSRKKNK